MILSWFNFYCLCRTYSNSTEASLMSIALYFWPASRDDLKKGRKYFRISLIFAAIACIFRPTNAIFWVYLGAKYVIQFRNKFKEIIADVIAIGGFAVTVSIAIDYFFYGKLVFTPLNFLHVNLREV